MTTVDCISQNIERQCIFRSRILQIEPRKDDDATGYSGIKPSNHTRAYCLLNLLAQCHHLLFVSFLTKLCRCSDLRGIRCIWSETILNRIELNQTQNRQRCNKLLKYDHQIIPANCLLTLLAQCHEVLNVGFLTKLHRRTDL